MSSTQKQRKETKKHARVSRRDSILSCLFVIVRSSESLLDVDRIMTGSTVPLYVLYSLGCGVHQQHLDSCEGEEHPRWSISLRSTSVLLTSTFTVIDGEENLEHPQQYVVYRQEIINYPASYTQANYTTRDFMLPPGTRVLALWPGSTAFYDAIVLPRSNIPVYFER